MEFEFTYSPGDLPPGHTFDVTVRPEGWVPTLTPEEAERGVVFLVQDDGRLAEAHTIIDPETGGVYAVPKD